MIYHGKIKRIKRQSKNCINYILDSTNPCSLFHKKYLPKIKNTPFLYQKHLLYFYILLRTRYFFTQTSPPGNHSVTWKTDLWADF